MRVLAIVILYNPDLQLLQKNVEAFVNHVETTMIWDNSASDTRKRNEEYVKKLFPQVVYKGDGQNHGISFALNEAWMFARQSHYDAMLTMDQDSVFADFKAYLCRVTDFWKDVGWCICGPTPNPDKSDNADGFCQVDHIITSGMLVPLPLLDTCNGYCQDFKVDGIDIELCYNMKAHGFPIYQDNGSYLFQRFGQQEKRHIPLLGEKSFSNYNKHRLYGIFRNHIIIWRRYRYPRKLTKLIFHEYFVSYIIKDTLILGEDKGEKTRAFLKGIIDGFKFPI